MPTDLFLLEGTPVTWSYTITNAGDVPLDNIAIDDDPLGPAPPVVVVNCAQTLAPGASDSCTLGGTVIY